MSQESVSKVYTLDPLQDKRWAELVERDARSTIFHSVPWLQALRAAYGYQPVVYTTTPPGTTLANGVVFCDVKSWITGRRLVSLPFSDHCEPLTSSDAELAAISAEIGHQLAEKTFKYFEMRPVGEIPAPADLQQVTEVYGFHRLDLTPDLDALFAAFHKDSTQRKIKRAERDGVVYREGPELLDEFYGLMVTTRKRHRVPPQPKEWFATLVQQLGSRLAIRVAFYQGRPIAGMLTVHHKKEFVYKYGCSDVRFNNVGGMHLLYWKSIQDAKEKGCTVFDFGRCDINQEGLMTFKRRWGAVQSELTYRRYAISDDQSLHFPPSSQNWKMRFAEQVFARCPESLLSLMGRLLYRHVG
ncbi:MAG TPA: GNAT family N-acetyltransferase [Dongiaceae bacterium]|nr:GNAT family N-acetyltransferase [Dongiaceae bacterium]